MSTLTRRTAGSPQISHGVTQTLWDRIANENGKAQISFYDRSTKGWSSQPQRTFLQRAASFGKTLTESGVEAGTYVIVATASPEATLIAFCGASLIGAVPAIIPIRTAFDGSVAAMDRIAGAQELLGSDARLVIETKNGRPIADAPDGAEPLTIDASAIVPWLAATPPAGFRPSPVSHIQLSSGSTGAGHGIAVSQSNVVANVNGLAERGSLTHYDVVVSWLPMYHDMGLIGHAMSSFILELDAYFMTPFDFLSSPITWLKAISDFRGSVSFSPTFGYELVAKKATLDDVSSLDLSSWKAAACGSEPISADVLERFYETFAASGLNKEAMLPCYGLAEATLAVTGIPAADSWKYITVDTESLAKLDVIEKKDPSIFDSNVSRVVSLGTPVHGVEVSLFDEDGNLIESELQCGEIVVTGVSVGSGYVQSGGTIKAFEGDRVRTGDIGFFDTGELYVVERSKNIVIRNGQNYSSLAIERTVAAATGLEVDDVLVLDRDIIVGSGLTAILCVAKDQDPAALIASVLAKVDQFEPPLEFIACVKRGSMPRTTSGKKQHVAVRDLLNRNAVKFLAYQEVVPTGANVDIEELAVDVASTQGQPADISIEAAREESALLELISGYIHARGLKVAVALTSRLQYDLDIDSLGLLELAMQIEDRFSVVFNREQVAELKTVRDVLALIAQTRGQEHVRTESIRALVQTVRTQIPQHYAVVDDVRENREAFIDGRWVTDLASCNYLGIEERSEIHDAVYEMHKKWGLQRWPTRAVAVARPAIELEARIADLIGVPDVLTFPTISLLHFGVLPVLAGSDGAIILDNTAHKSTQEAAALASAKGTLVSTFRHNDWAELERKLQRAQDRRRRVVVIDGVYSMSGAVAEIARFQRIAEKYDAIIYVDDAHGFGVLGEHPNLDAPYGHCGNGTIQFTSGSYDRIIYVGGMAKAYSTPLAFVSCPTPQDRHLFETASTMIFGHAVSMAAIAQANAALDINDAEGDQIRTKLEALTKRLRGGAEDLGFEVEGPMTPIINVVMGSIERLVVGTNVLWEDGVLLTPAMFPAAPIDRGGVRFTVTPNLSDDQIDKVLGSLARLRDRLDHGADSNETVIDLRGVQIPETPHPLPSAI